MLRYLPIFAFILFSFSANANECAASCSANDLNKAKAEYERVKTEAATAETQAAKETPEFVPTIKATMKAGVDSAQEQVIKADNSYQLCVKSCSGK